MNRVALLIASLALTACGEPDELTRTDACQEQAIVWCAERTGESTTCEAHYADLCTARPSVDVDDDAQIACLDAIANMDPPYFWDRVPAECRATWETPAH
jgi:hypothetical protein